MALVPKICLVESGDASYVQLYDNTGTYDVDVNPGGYGPPNPASTDIVAAQINFEFDNIANPITLDFDISAGIVGTVTKTDQLGNVETLTNSDFNINLFPFPSNDPIQFPASFFIPAATIIPDQYVTITYTLSTANDTFANVFTFLLNSVSCCCLQKAWLKYAQGKCNDVDPIKIQNAMNGLLAENAVGNLPAARNELKILNKLCAGCGCGC